MAAAFKDLEEDSNLGAPESIQTKRAREKLKKQIEDAEKKITRDALKETSHEIHRWIARHAHARVTLKEKNISLFDENQNAAKLSGKVAFLAQKIKETN